MEDKTLQVEFDTMVKKPGTLDVAVRVDMETGHFEFVIEENGLPTTVPYILFAGALTMVLNQAAYRFYNGYEDEAKG
jgi:hypothetical protein